MSYRDRFNVAVAGLRQYTRGDLLAGLAVGVVVDLAASAIFGIGMLAGAVAGVAGAGAAIARRRFIEALEDRSQDADSARWFVRINNVEVGTLTDAQYAAIWLDVMRSPRVYFRQVFNCLDMAVRLVRNLVEAVPVLLTLAILSIAAFSPQTIGNLVVTARGMSEAEVTAAVTQVIHTFPQFFFMAWFICIAVAAAFGGAGYFGFRNVFMSQAIEDVRTALDVAVTGDVVLSRSGMRVVYGAAASAAE